jgi:NAD dependent epimerase/dehydratase family enzyme
LGETLHRPAILPVPAFALRLALGEMADALLLASARVRPARLEQAGYSFAQPTIESALRHLLKP